LTALTDQAKTVISSFTSVEQLASWAFQVLDEANPNASLSASGGYPELILQEAIYSLLRTDGTEQWRTNCTFNLPLAPDWKSEPKTWLKVEQISSAAIPARFLA
jgi:hypothetical protein